MTVQVILIEDFTSLGHVGDVVPVKPGYARNFLFPRGIAVDASSTNGKLMKHKMEAVHAKRAKLKAQAEDFGKKLAASPLEFTLKVGEAGKSFGAVTSRDIEAAFKAKGFEVNKKQIKLHDPFKNAGEYKVEIKVHADVTVPVTVKVAIEAQNAKRAAAEGEDAPVKGKKSAKGKSEKGKSKKQNDSQDDASEAAKAE
jgi:large subunit ribosomal protein L9